MKLYIAEKPSLAKTIAASLGATKMGEGCIKGDDCIVTWCFGHLYEMYDPEDYNEADHKWDAQNLPLIPEAFKLKVKKDAQKQVKNIKQLISDLQNNDAIVNCGDPDREGQLLVDQVIEESGFRGVVLRAWLKDLTKKGLQKTLSNLENNKQYESIKNAALARSRADWVVGINMTRAYTCKSRKFDHDGVLTVGRVQTPTLNMVVERDQKIAGFVSKKFYEIEAVLITNNVEFKAKEKCEKTFDIEVAKSKQIGERAIVIGVEDSNKNESAPLPFTLSDLQSECNKRYGLAAQTTLDVAQSLYEKHKAISYPRTDTAYLSEGELLDKKELIDDLLKHLGVSDLKVNDTPKCFNDKKVGAHTGIIPLAIEAGNLNDKEHIVFDLIKRRFAAQFLKPFNYKAVKAEFISGGVNLIASGKSVIDRGFRQVTHPNKTEFEKSVMPPELKEGDEITIKSSELKTGQTTPPKHFTEGTLIKAMANIAQYLEDGSEKSVLKDVGGIGTEATRAGIIAGLKDRGMLELRKNNIVSTKVGRKFMKLIGSDIKSPLMTANWELKLKKIEDGEMTVNDYLDSLKEWTTKKCKEAADQDMSLLAGEKCNACDDGYMVSKTGKFGTFKACTNYPDCKNIISDKKRKPKRRTSKRKKRAAS